MPSCWVSMFAVTMALAAEPLPSKVDTLVVCPREFAASLQPWLDYRRKQKHQISVVEPAGDAKEVSEQIRKESASRGLKTVVLVGDSQPRNFRPKSRDGDSPWQRLAPTHFVAGPINRSLGESLDIATDAPFSDLDGDGSPDVAIGRISVDSPEELDQFIAKVIRYETEQSHGLWRRRINLVAGVGNFGAIADSLIENATRACLVGRIPQGFDTCMTYGSWRSPYFPSPDRFRDTCLTRLNEGCLFWVYIGHGSPTHCDHVRHDGFDFPILRNRDCREIRCATGSPVALFLCCYTGAFDLPNDCLAEEMLRCEEGPVAAVAASRISLPYSLALFGRGLIEEYFHGDAATLGELMRRAKVRLKNHKPIVLDGDELPEGATADDRLTALIDSAAAILSPSGADLATERNEHVALLNLLGDPLLRVSRPKTVAVKIKSPALHQGGEIAIEIDTPVEGTARVELVCPRGKTKEPLAPRKEAETKRSHFDRLQEEYERAIDGVWTSHEFAAKKGANVVEFQIGDARGPIQIRVFIDGVTEHALGSADAEVAAAK